MDMGQEIIVSVYCLAYNHEKYIQDCLEGFVKQKTSLKMDHKNKTIHFSCK